MEKVNDRLLPPDLGPGRDVALEALRRTQGAMRQRGRALGLGLVLTALALVCLPDGKGLVEGLRMGGVPLAAALLAVAGYYWWRYLGACKRLAGTGMAPARSLKARLAWAFCGWFVGVAVGELACAAFGLRSTLPLFTGTAVGFGALWAGGKIGELSEAAQARTVHTLFGYDNFDDDQGNG